jgi:dTDP-4-dehydrorhamnose reductase
VRVLVTGGSGQLGAYLLRELVQRETPTAAWGGARPGERFGVPLRAIDLADTDQTAAAFHEERPDVVIHAAAMARIADCYRDPGRAERVNVQGTALLAELADRARARLVYVSTDLVFDGERGNYREDDPVRPLSVYGRTKAAAEQAVLAHPRQAVVRPSLLFGPTRADRPAFFDEQLTALRQRRPCPLFADEWRTPLALVTAARGLLAVAASDFAGLLHLGGPERLSRLEMGQRLASFLRLDPSVLGAVTRASLPAPEPRPRDVSLDSSRWRQLFPAVPWPAWEEALREMGTEPELGIATE